MAAKVSCCGAQNFSGVKAAEILTAATGSPRFICRWQRSDRSIKTPGDEETEGSFVSRRAIRCVKLWPFTMRSHKIFVFVAVKGSALLLCRCR